MKSFLLLILSLMTGCVASFTVKGCRVRRVEFTCIYPTPEREYDSVVVEKPNKKWIESTAKNKWEHKYRFSVYHDTENKKLKVAIKQLRPWDFGEYECQFKNSSDEKDEVEVDVKVEKNDCQKLFIQTASTKPNITCNYPGDEYESDEKFFCKETESSSTCEDILTTKSSPKSNERFTLTETNSGFNISISHVSPSDTGVYWCGVNTGSYRATLTQIQLEVTVPPATSTPSVASSTRSTPTTPSVQSIGSSQLTAIIAVVVCAALLVLALILVFIYKRIQHSKNTRGEKAQNNKEDHTYDEIQERPQEPDSGTAIKTIYTTANFPTNPSSVIHYCSNSSFKTGSVEVSAGDTYSTVNDNDQHPTYSTVNHPSGLSEDPFYSKLKEPQQP